MSPELQDLIVHICAAAAFLSLSYLGWQKYKSKTAGSGKCTSNCGCSKALKIKSK